MKAPPTIEADTDPRRPLPVRPVPGAEFEATLHGPAPMRAPGELTSPDLRRNEGVPAAELMPSAGVTLRGAAVSVELDTGETVANPHSDDLVTDVALALPDDLGTEDIDPLAEPPAPAIMPPRGVSLAVSKGSAVPRPVAHVLAEAAAAVSGPTPGLDTAVTAPMAVPPMAMIDDSAPTSAAPAPVAPASTGPTGPSRLAPAAPPVMPSGTGSTPVPTPGGWATPSWSPVPVAAAAPPAPALATSPPRAPGPAPQPPPAAPPSVPVYAQPPAKPVSAPVYPPAPGVYVDPSLAAATYQAAPAPPIYPTAQLPALDYQPPAGTSSSWQRHRAMVADEGGDMTEIISVVSVRRRRWPVIAITSAVVVVIAIVVLAITSRSGASDERPRPPAPTPAPTPGPSSTGVAPTPAPTDVAPAPTDVAPAPTDVAPAPTDVASAPTEVAPAIAPPAPSDACAVTFTSSPDGATVLIAGAELGTTPITVEVPCATRAATFRRDRYQTRTQPLTLAPGAQTVSARLERPTFSVTIASAPKGAKVTVGGRAVGVTPVTIQVPGFEGMPVEVVLRGFAPHRERVYATRSGQRLDIRLRRR
ncbi:MAG: PEGA domain-containing protein [Myxococcales bacterium]|nr:PEGA domain-containing protein [Myxococcales bacterium]